MRGLRRHEGLQAALPGWVLGRVGVAVGFLVAAVAAEEFHPGDRPLQLSQGLFAWDAAFYRDIADVGYDGVSDEALRFFPLLPILARIVSIPLLGNVGLALVIVVNAAALAAGVLLHRLVVEELGDRDAARRAAWLLAVLPPAAVLVLGYAESLLLALSIGAFLALRRQRWWWAALFGLLAASSRPMGLALMIPAAIEVSRGIRGLPRRALLGRAAAVAGPAVGVGLFLAWVERERGDWQLPLRLQNTDELRGGFANPLSTVLDGIRAIGDDRLGEALHVPWIAFFLVLLVVALRRLPVSYGAYAAALLAVALSGHTLGSLERYGLAAFPLVVALALLVGEPVRERAVLVACGAGLTGFAALAFLGAFVP